MHENMGFSAIMVTEKPLDNMYSYENNSDWMRLKMNPI